MVVLRAFLNFPDEAALIGRMLAGYADLEIDLMNCVNAVRGNLDTVLKVMFRSRGETRRIEMADALARQHYHQLKIGKEYEQSISAVRHCMRIRNQYAHCVWWDDNSGQLAFANLEEVAKKNAVVKDLRKLTTKYVNIDLLKEQFAYFEYADNLLVWLNYKARELKGQPPQPNQVLPKQLEQPQLYL